MENNYIQISVDAAQKALNIASSEETKTVLKTLYGDQLKPKEITDGVKDILDVLDITKPSLEVMNIIKYNGSDRKLIGAKNFILAELIAEALNEGWTPNWSNTNEKKWFAWFDGSNNFAFSHSGYDYWASDTTVGSRLVFKSEKLMLHAVRTFPDIYKELLTK